VVVTKADDELARLKEEERELGDARRRAADAKAVLENDLVKEAFDDMEKALTRTIRLSTVDQAQLREDTYRMLRIMDMFKGHFEKHLSDGQIADHRLAEIKDRRKWLTG